MEARENLIIVTDDRITGTADGASFFSWGVGCLEKNTAGKPIPPL